MFGFRKKRRSPTLCPSNPGIGVKAKVAFSTGDRNWTEHVNIVDLAAAVLKKLGYAVANEKTWLLHADSGFMILPQLVGMQPLDGGGVHTVTTVQTNHPTLAPAGVFEYQHAAGDSIADSISQGLEQWVQTDFVPLLDALRPRLESCTAMEWTFPAKDRKPARVRRAVLGPAARFVQEPPSKAEEEEHPFCHCCLLTNSFEAFRDLIEGVALYCLRLYAARDAEGVPQADCRVNGEDWDKGAQALQDYARTWPAAGVEFRKQYVLLQTIPTGFGIAGAAGEGGTAPGG